MLYENVFIFSGQLSQKSAQDKFQESLDEIKKKIAEAGHDSEDFKATDEAYANLHSCCKYDREKQL